MRRRLLSIMLIFCMIQTLVPRIALAEEKFYEEDVTWIGTKKELQKTLNGFFDSGLRKVPVGDQDADGKLTNIKYGLIDESGNFAAEPVYDKIKAEYLWAEASETQSYPDNPSTESIFVDGYVQAIRDGKMGLLDSTGREVIPCVYDAVGLPVEGVSRVIKASKGVYYLGYWNLKLGKEIVAPDTYIVSGADATAAGTPQSYEALGRSAEWSYADDASDYYKSNGVNRLAARYDFNGGYALAPTGKTQRVKLAAETDYKSLAATLVYAQIIDKKGKEILAGGPYPYRSGGIYPQSGPYMVYEKLSNKKISLKTDSGGTISFTTHLESGVVGAKGILISAQYHGGIRGNSATGWFPADANMQILSELGLVMTAKDVYNGKHEDSARRGVVNLKNKTVIPFESGYEGLQFDSKNKIFDGRYYYRSNGTKIPNSQLAYGDPYMNTIANGYFQIGKEGKTGYYGFASIKTGKTYTNKNLYSEKMNIMRNSRSNLSVKGTVWINKGGTGSKAKWGLVNLQGKVLIPFQYENVTFGDIWERSSDAYATVKKNGKWGIVNASGKVILPCKYKSIGGNGKSRYLNIKDQSGKVGVFDLHTSKIIIPCRFNSGISLTSSLAAHRVMIGKSQWVLIDMKGKQLTDSFLYINEPVRGLFYNSNYDMYGPDGKIVFPERALYATKDGHRVYIGEDLTLIVKEGKVGYINASRIASKERPLPEEPLDKSDEAEEVTKEEKYYLIAYPDKQVYKTGEAFNLSGFIAHRQDSTGARHVLDNSKIYFTYSAQPKDKITDGYKFTKAGVYTLNCYYEETLLKNVSFEVKIIDDTENKLIDSGNYYMKIYGKYIYPVQASGMYYLELWDKKPDKPFAIKLVNNSEERGPEYTISYNGGYIGQPTTKNGAQLQSSGTAHRWRINKYSSFCTIRDYGNQKLAVNASGQKKDNGTLIIVWSHTGSAPSNAKIEFIKVK